LVKFAGAGPGRQALLAEFLAGRLGRHWALPIPEAIVVRVDASLPRAGTDEFWDVLSASEGLNLAIKMIPNAKNVVPDFTLPAETLGPMRAYDELLVNWDRTALSRNLMRDEAGKLWWIDHGSCRFLQAALTKQAPRLPSNHFLAGGGAQPACAVPCPERAFVEDLVRCAPREWVASLGVDPMVLASELHEYFRRNLQGG
jgi:hypothetical protein